MSRFPTTITRNTQINYSYEEFCAFVDAYNAMLAEEMAAVK